MVASVTNGMPSLLKKLATSLIEHGSIETTLPKAKELSRYITKKKGDLHNRRQVIAKLSTQAAAFKLVDEIAPQLTGRTRCVSALAFVWVTQKWRVLALLMS